MVPNTGPVDTTGSTAAPEVPDAQLDAPAAPSDDAATSGDAGGAPVALDFAALNAAGGDSRVWGEEMSRFLKALTGSTIDAESLAGIFGAYGYQIQGNTYRAAAVVTANYAIEPAKKSKDTLIALMDLRNDIAEQLLQTVA